MTLPAGLTEADVERAADDDPHDHYADDFDCWNCGGEGRVNYCIDGCCLDQDDIYCEFCSRRCDVCSPKPAAPPSPVGEKP